MNYNIIYKSEFGMKINDGTYIWVSSRGKALRDSEGKAMLILHSHFFCTTLCRY